MDDSLRKQVYNNLNLVETDDLLEIWQDQNTGEWDAETFIIIKEILTKRLGYMPSLPVQMKIKQSIENAERYWQAGLLEKALNECNLAIKAMPENPMLFNLRGLIYDDLEQLENAITDFQMAIRLDPDLTGVWENMAIVEEELEEEFFESFSIQKLDLALEYIYDDEPEKALEACESAKETLPNLAIAFNYLGLLLDELGELNSAIEAYIEATQLNSRFYPAWINLGNAKIREEEELYLQKATENWSELLWDDKTALELVEIQDWDDNVEPVPGWVYISEKAFLLSGYPGHRLRQGRSGYDPLESDFELARMQGIIIRALFDFKFRTHNPIYLFLMFFMGIIMTLPILFGVTTFFQGEGDIFGVVMSLAPYWIPGPFLLLNVFLSFSTKKPEDDEDYGNAFF